MTKKKTYPTFRKILWIVLGFCLAGICISAAELKRNSSINGLEVFVELLPSGDNLVTQQDIIDDLTKTFGPVENMDVKTIDPRIMESVLLENPFLKNVHVYLDAHQMLNVDATQREPMVRIMDVKNQHYYLDREGVKIPVSPHYTARVPVANGHISAIEELQIDEESNEVIKSLYSVAAHLHDDKFAHALIDQLYVNDKKQIMMIPKMGVGSIMIGDSSEMEDKMERLKIFYKEVIPYEGYQKYKQIDLRFADQVVCKTKS